MPMRFPLKKKTNLSFAPIRLTVWETKLVLCQRLQQGHEARLGTSRLEGMDFTTDFYLIVTIRTGQMQTTEMNVCNSKQWVTATQQVCQNLENGRAETFFSCIYNIIYNCSGFTVC